MWTAPSERTYSCAWPRRADDGCAPRFCEPDGEGTNTSTGAKYEYSLTAAHFQDFKPGLSCQRDTGHSTGNVHFQLFRNMPHPVGGHALHTRHECSPGRVVIAVGIDAIADFEFFDVGGDGGDGSTAIGTEDGSRLYRIPTHRIAWRRPISPVRHIPAR